MAADVGLIGLAVMGRNLVLNLDDHGFQVAVFNRTVEKVDEFLAGEASGTRVVGARTLQELVSQLARPRRIILMVKAGQPVDALIAELAPLLEQGDIVIDGGNSHFLDSARRQRELENKGLLFVATGISGGEEGARHGPSFMPGGSEAAWPHVKDMLQAVAAKVDGGVPCCEWVGPGGAGHFVKMVHNGIEYGDMQIIAEVYQLLRDGMGMGNDQAAEVFERWNQGDLESFLIEITGTILRARGTDGSWVVDRILDTAGQKGTGRWTVEAALDLGVPLGFVTEAVFARSLAAARDVREKAAMLLGEGVAPIPDAQGDFVQSLEQALYASKIISYAQGFMLLSDAGKRYGWNLNLGGTALLWRGGCIIRSRFLGRIHEAYRENFQLTNLLLAPFFQNALRNALPHWRRVVAAAVASGIPVPALSSALSFFDAFRSRTLPANLIQAQRDFFGAHMFERVDAPRGSLFHAHWGETPVVLAGERT